MENTLISFVSQPRFKRVVLTEICWIGEVIFGFVIKSGYFELDVCVGCALIDLFAKGFRDLVSAKKVFDKMPERNSVTWTLLITRYAQLGYHEDGIELFLSMLLCGFMPDRFTLSSVVSACAELGFVSVGQQLHSWVIKSGLCLDVCVGCSLVDMYAKCATTTNEPMEDARKVFQRMPHHNVMSWTAIITGHVQSGGLDRTAIELYCKMITQGDVLPNHITYSSLLKACASLSNLEVACMPDAGSMEDAQMAFEVLVDKNLISHNAILEGYAKNASLGKAFNMFNQFEETTGVVDSFTFASLLSASASVGAIGKGEEIHARCGDIEAAARVFSRMEQRNVISWTSIVTSFAKHGMATRALETFHQMLNAGMKPNEVTYIAVLSACSHVGMVVDLLGRSGSLEKALDLIKSMPFKADALVWRTLLGACQVHGNTELGRLAAKMIIGQDPDDPAAYILLSNLYASKGQWEEVVKIRKTMKERNLVKEAGCSWVEAENQTHKFYVGDTCHPRTHEIYKELHQLVMDIKKLGYVPDTGFVLHDMDEKEKEGYLVQHSEKIAVAFGLISMSKTKP
ncbi:hypothetical protein OSB04_014490 [Centaurea solstitialis]|uniref:DYW domain-containing protein n=1 Tax=Centaurea solstitialis TaxID=347529 RepID=A0AA38WFM2_9ASTR|nr:hypothetical protein OSB04_014490 [Centaurea solstitialis]